MPFMSPKAWRQAVPAPAELHALNRFSYGWTPALHRQVRATGGFDRWFDRQLTPAPMDTFTKNSAQWWTSINASTAQLAQRDRADIEKPWQFSANYQRWALVRRIRSPRQVQELMAEFWEHHFHVPAAGSGESMFRADYGRMIREKALGKVSDLLVAVTTHPAMGVYLDNAVSTAKHPNENLGRELLELHTVGVGHYTEADVKGAARILTGYRVDVWQSWRVYYDPASHWRGTVKAVGFQHANTSADGRAVTSAFLRHLARHRDTAQTIARKLAVRFVRDSPSQALVDRLAKVYLANDTAIAPVLKALVASPEFRASGAAKVRTPSDDVVATYRALGVAISRPTGENTAANQILWQVGGLGLTPFGWPRPDGQPDQATAWATPSRFLSSLDLHFTMSGGWYPRVGARYVPAAAWLPRNRRVRKRWVRGPIRFDALVDQLSRRLLGRKATPALQSACRRATGLKAGTRITASHGLVKWEFARLLTTLLDSPHHFAR